MRSRPFLGRVLLAVLLTLAAVPVAMLLVIVGYAVGENDDEVWSAELMFRHPVAWVSWAFGALWVTGVVLAWAGVRRPTTSETSPTVLIVAAGTMLPIAVAAIALGVLDPSS